MRRRTRGHFFTDQVRRIFHEIGVAALIVVAILALQVLGRHWGFVL